MEKSQTLPMTNRLKMIGLVLLEISGCELVLIQLIRH